MKRIFLLLVFVALLPACAFRVAYVDLRKIWENSKEIGAERIKVEKFISESQAELKAKEFELNAIQDAAKDPAASEELRAAIVENFKRKYIEYQNAYQLSNKQRQDIDNAAQALFIEKVRGIATKMAQTKGFDLVLAKENLLCIKDTYDITLEVLMEMNRKEH